MCLYLAQGISCVKVLLRQIEFYSELECRFCHSLWRELWCIMSKRQWRSIGVVLVFEHLDWSAFETNELFTTTGSHTLTYYSRKHQPCSLFTFIVLTFYINFLTSTQYLNMLLTSHHLSLARSLFLEPSSQFAMEPLSFQHSIIQ